MRIGAFGGYYGDRRGALDSFVDEPVDVLIADYLAELTMLVLGKNQERGKPGYAEGFLEELRPSLPWIASSGVRVVTNAGGLDPSACAAAIRELCAELGIEVKVAAVCGDNVKAALTASDAHQLVNLDTGESFPVDVDQVITANAYFGAGGIVTALERGAQIVVTGRVTDAALALGPAIAHFGWATDDYDAFAGAIAAGHAIECGAQVTGGNYCFFDREGDLGMPGMPIAEVHADGSAVVTKIGGSGGVVNVDTVTAQMVYEVTSTEYHNPDVVVDWTSIRLEDEGPDRVRVSGVRGTAPTPFTKLSLSYHGGYRNSMTLGLTGPNVSAKVAWLRDQISGYVGSPEDFDAFDISLIGGERPDPESYGAATSWLVVSARDADYERVGREQFADRIVELGISSIPGLYFTGPPTKPRSVGIQWPCLIPKEDVEIVVDMGEEVVEVKWGPFSAEAAKPADQSATRAPQPLVDHPAESTMVALGTVLGARSGDKAGIANLGVWAQDDAGFAWLSEWLTEDRLRSLMPELEECPIVRYDFANMQALNFVIYGFLERGVSATMRFDAQAKGLGEYLRARVAPVPIHIVESSAGSAVTS
ncbi:DUF1446 domain-containing protein [Nocardioides hwasunensis]|uniref:DUF1446 domain-containing protein n=1 Tax=Nocardioides hwasunensis TaxID=397258 RepID=A0ABR8MG70_9ACTN|nr:DUF1446 domain-containing protein [Nocardioides hwasunensis]